MDIGGALTSEFQQLQQGWNNWVANPANRAMLIQTGVNMMQPMAIGQNPIGQIGQSLGAGAQAKGRYEEQARQDEQTQYERTQKESDRTFARDQATKKLGLEGRQVAVSERNAASLDKYREMGPKSLSSLFGRDQDQLTAKLWAAAKAEADAANNSLDAFNEGFVPKTPQDYLADPAWLQKTQAVIGSLPGMPGSGSAGTVPPQAISSQVPGQTNTGTPQAQPVPQPSGGTPKWKIGDEVPTPQGRFKLMYVGGKYQWQKMN